MSIRITVPSTMIISALCWAFSSVSIALCAEITNAIPYKARPLPLSAVRVTGGPLKTAQELDAKYLLQLEPDRMLFALRDHAGLQPKADQGYGGWDSTRGKQLTGHIAGHYLSAVSYMYAATGDDRYKQRADYIVSQMKEIQDAQGDGYIGGLTDAQGTRGKILFQQLADGTIRSSAFELNGMWSPWYVQHKIFAGLRDAYRYTGNKMALDVEVKFATWAESIVSKLDEQQIQRMLGTEFGGMNEIMADLYHDTADAKWLKACDYFYHKAIVDPLAAHNDILGGKHGNTQVPKMQGELARFIYSGNETSGNAAKFFWDQVVYHHSFATGGHGYDEYFGPPDQISNQIDGTNQRSPDLRTAESCNVYNMMKMSRTLFSIDPDVRYIEFLERGLFNHVLGSINLTDGRVCYMVPVGQNVQHEYQGANSFTCCVGSGMESHALHGDAIYSESPNADKLWINLFIPSTADWKAGHAKIEMQSSFPEGEAATIKIEADAPREFTIAIRRPAWAGDGFAVKVNGETVASVSKPQSYVELKRTWKAGDTIALTLPKTLHSEPLPDNPNRMALMWGPLVLAGDLGPSGARGGGGARRGGRGPTTAPDFPAFVSPAKAVGELLHPIAEKPGSYTATRPGADAANVTLSPFYKLSGRRYGIYWDVFTPQEWTTKAAAGN